MRYCARCLYPENARPTIIFDESGICSGCRYHESRSKLEVDWEQRAKMFEQVVDSAKAEAQRRGLAHDCIIPVSGGKDSHYQVWLLKEKYNLRPLLVTFNHAFNSPSGQRNLENLVERSGCDLIRYTAGLDSVRRIARHMLKTVGDLTWHYHAGIRTLPFQIATKFNIPLIVWGEHGFAELTGIVTLDDFVEFTRWTRKEHDMRGFEAEDLVGKGGIRAQDVAPYVYPSDAEIATTEVRGIYLSNYFPWDAKHQAETMIHEWGFGPVTYRRERTFNLYAKIEDHANDVHDYLKFLKFGYGRATDDASMEIRHGRLTREEGIALVRKYDSVEPSTLEFYCDFLGISRAEFYQSVQPMRDSAIWEHDDDGWAQRDAVDRHEIGEAVEAARVPTAKDQTFSPSNRHLYYNDHNPPLPSGDASLDVMSPQFRVG